MRRTLVIGLLGLLGLALQASLMPAKALLIAPAPTGDRVLNAQIIVVGKVTALEDKVVKAANGQEYTIAVVKVDEALVGAKGLTHVRVGFLPPPPVVQPRDPAIVPPIRRYPTANLTKDQEVLLFLQPLGKESFFVAPMYFDVVDKKNNPNFDKEVATIKRSLKLMEDPKAGLKSQDANDRLMTASLLLTKYRTVKGPVKGGVPKQEPIDAEESKLILLALAEADWNKPFTVNEPAPRTVFSRLGVTAKDGFTPPKVAKEYPDAAKKWLKDNADKYRIQRYVPEAEEK